MKSSSGIPTSRIEAFSDGVIAIIITVMVFDLKLNTIPTETTVWAALSDLMPKFFSYGFSFLMLAIMWVNHHQLFHQIRQTDRRLLWMSINLLFWMSLVPFCTNFIGANPALWQAASFYGMTFFMSAMSFTLLRSYVLKAGLLHENISQKSHARIRRKNIWAMGLYASAALLSPLSVYIAFALLLIVPGMYFVPEKSWEQ